MAVFRDVLGLQVQLDMSATDVEFRRVTQALSAASAGFATSMGKAIATASDDLQKNFSDAIGAAAAQGMDATAVRNLQAKFYQASQPLLGVFEQARDLEAKLAAETDERIKDEIKQRLAGLQAVQKEHQNAAKLEMARITLISDQKTKLQEAIFKHEESKLEEMANKRAKLFQDYTANASKSFEEKFEGTTKGLGEFFGGVMQLNLEGVLKSFGSGLSRIGTNRQGKAAGEGGDSKIGKVLETLGKSIGMIGMVVGGLAMLVKTLIDADNQAKEWNRSILQASGAMDVLGKDGGDLSGRLENLRQSVVNTTSALRAGIKGVIDFGITSKEYLEIVNKFQEVGVTLDQMRGSAKNLEDEMENYTKYVKAATVASRMLGEDFGTTATNMGNYMKDLGLSLDEVQNGFAMIAKEAANSGTGTKRFFNMVLQATSGVTMYNVRLGGTAKLLGQLTRILGAKGGGEMLQNVSQTMGQESYQDRYKRILTTGQGLTGKIIGKEAERQAASMRTAVQKGGPIDTKGMTEAAAAVVGKLGSGTDEEIVKTLSKIGEKDRASLIAGIRAKDEGLAKRLDASIDVAKGTRGDLASQAKALEGLGPGGKMVMELNRMQAVIGKPLHEMNMFEKMAYQQQTGMSTENIAQLERVSRAVTGDFETAKKLQKDIADGKIKQEEANELLKKTGMEIKDGQIVGKETKKVIKDTNDALLNYEETSSAEEEQALTMQEKLSKEVAQNTYDLTNIVSESVVDILNTIAGFVSDILVFLGLKDDPEETKDAVQAVQQSAKDQAKQIDDQIKAINNQAKELMEQTKHSKDPKVKAEVQAKLDAAKEQVQDLRNKRTAKRTEATEAMGASKELTGSKLELFKKMTGAKGGSASAEDIMAASKMTEEEAKGHLEKAKAAKVSKQVFVADTSEGGAGGGFVDTKEGEAAEKDYLKNLTEQTKSGDRTADNTKRTAKSAEETLKELKDHTKVLKDEHDLNVRKTELEALAKAGFTPEELARATAASATGKDYSSALLGLKGLSEEKFLQSGVQIKVDDALVTSDGRVIKGNKGDAVAFIDEEAMRSGGAASTAGTASVIININGANGNVQQQVVAALKQFYTNVTGVA